jgi:hypothetical protein
MSEQKQPWWDSVKWVGGDNIQTIIGDYATNVVAGKSIVQTLNDVLGKPTPTDLKEIQGEINQLRQKIQASSASEAVKAVAEYNVQLLEKELTKAEKLPEQSIVQQAGEWLLDNLPDVLEAVVSLFASPAVGRVVAKGGESMIKWIKDKLGHHSK